MKALRRDDVARSSPPLADVLDARRAMLALVSAQMLLWTPRRVLTHGTMPLDVARGARLGLEWHWGYHKHPPLATWLVAGAFRLLGDLGPPGSGRRRPATPAFPCPRAPEVAPLRIGTAVLSRAACDRGRQHRH